MAVTKSRRAQGGIFGSGREVHDLRQTPIQPAPVPSTPFVQAPRYETGGNLTRLAQSLTNLNQSLNNWANVNAREKADPNSRENQEYAAKLQQMSLEELKREAHNNTHGGIKIKETILNRLIADKGAAQFKLGWTEFYHNEFDKTNGNIDEAFEAYRQQFSSNLPSTISQGMFFQLTEGTKQSFLDADQKIKIDYASQELTGGLTDSFRNTIDDAINVNGKSVEEAASLVMNNGAEMAEFMSMPPQMRDEALLNLASEYAQKGNVAAVEALLGADRGAQGAQSLSTLYPNKALSLIDKAHSVMRSDKLPLDFDARADIFNRVSQGDFSLEDAKAAFERGIIKEREVETLTHEAQAYKAKLAQEYEKRQQQQVNLNNHLEMKNNLLNSNINLLSHHGTLANLGDREIPNEKGTETITITPKQQKQEVIDYKEQQWNAKYQQLLENNLPEEQARDAINTERLDFYAAIDEVNPLWESWFKGLPTLATQERLAKDGNAAKEALSRVRLYQNLKAQNPIYLSKLIGNDKRAQEFFDAFEINYEFQSGDISQALYQAAREVATPEQDVKHRRLPLEMVEELTGQIASQLKGLDPTLVENNDLIRGRINQLAKAGALPDKIAAQITREIKDSHLVYNGVLMRNSGQLPPDFIGLADIRVGEVFENYKSQLGIEEGQDLYLIPDSTQTIWEIHSKSNKGLMLGQVTINDLEQLRERRAEEQDLLTRQALNKAGLKADAKMNEALERQAKTLEFDKTPLGQQVLNVTPSKIEGRIKKYEGMKGQFGGAHDTYILQQIEQLKDNLMQIEGRKMLSQGILPNSKQWIEWKIAHGRDISPLEHIYFDEFYVPKN